MEENLQLTDDDYKFILIIMTQAARLGCFRDLVNQQAVKLYNKISKILDQNNDKELKN